MNELTPQVIEFEKTASGCLNARYRGTEIFVNVRCVPLFPLSRENGYVSVMKKADKEYEEIGIIKDLGAFPASQQTLVGDDVRFRYFVPEIVDVARIVSKNGTDEWFVKTDKGDKTITIRDRKESIQITDHGIVFITDFDKVRYRITDVRALPEKARAMVERLLP